MLHGSILLAVSAQIRGVIHVSVEFDERLNGHVFQMIRRGSEAHDCSATNDCRAKFFYQGGGLLKGVSASDDVIDDDAGINFTLIDLLAEHAFTIGFSFGPVNLFSAERVADAECHRNTAGAGTDYGNLWQLARDVSFETKLPA